MALVDIIAGVVIAVVLLGGGLWCWRRAASSKLNRRLRLQAIVLALLVPVSIAVTLDAADRYSASLGRLVGTVVPIYIVATAVFVNVRPSRT